MEKLFTKWLTNRGIKKYLVAVIIGLVIDILFLSNYGTIWSYGSGGLHIVMVILGHLVLLGFNIGLTYHMISGYKLWKKRELRKK